MKLKTHLKQMAARMMFGQLPETQANYGEALKAKILGALNATPHPDFTGKSELKSLNGDPMGSLQVYQADGIDRLVLCSIDVAPGMRYVNFHIIPDANRDVPRFNTEGMLTSKGSQLSIDLYPDLDIIMDFAHLQNWYAGLPNLYDKARQNRGIAWQPSRLAHMRAFCSPYFLLAYSIPGGELGNFAVAASNYFDHWLGLYKKGKTLPDATANGVKARRKVVRDVMANLDPDREMVVDVFGEETTLMIEAALLP